MKDNMIKTAALTALFLSTALTADAQDFDSFFTDSTLRINYTFSGNATEQHIALDELCLSPRWYGKHRRLAQLPVSGNGQITLRDHKSGTVIYRNSFSTLFHEWLQYPEAQQLSKAFENVFIVPMPRDTVDITVDLRNNRREIMTSMTHRVAPADILIRRMGFKSRTPYKIIQQAADTTRCIHLAYVAEGYREDEMDIFLKDVDTAVDALFSHEPFHSMRDRFYIVAVESESEESGTSEPSRGIWKNTILHSHYDTFYSERYLTTLALKDLHDILAGIPYEHIIVLVNTTRYGGGGILNSYNLSATHGRDYRPVVVHEFGHSFAGLADEYAYENEAVPMYPHDIEPWEKNITTLVDFRGKWESLLDDKWKTSVGGWKTSVGTWKQKSGLITTTPPQDNSAGDATGIYEGAGYSLKGVYRAKPNCRMNTNKYPAFCPACRKALQDIIDFYTTTDQDALP